MIKQESTWDKETGLLTSFTEYIDGRLLIKQYYDEYGNVCRFERNACSGETKWDKPNDVNKKVIYYKDTLGGLIDIKPVNEGKIDVMIDVIFNVKSEYKSEYKSIYNQEIIGNADEIIENNTPLYCELRLKIFDVNDRRVLLIEAVKEPNMSKFVLYRYIEDIYMYKDLIYIKSNDTIYDKTLSSKYYNTVTKEEFLNNAQFLHYLDEYNIELPND